MTDARKEDGAHPSTTKAHPTDAVAAKLADKVEKAASKTGADKEKKADKPAGGYDNTSVPKASMGFTLKFTFHKATNLPFADINDLSSDPYVLAQLNTKIPSRHKQDPHLRFRSRTIRKNVNPEWESSWSVANVPSSGFQLRIRLYDEDPGDHDDRLGSVDIQVDRLSESWEGIKEQSYDIKKRSGSKRAYLFRGCAAFFNRDIHMSGNLFVSIQLLGRTEEGKGGHVYTIGPCNWTRHYSPLIGRLAGTRDPENTVKGGEKEHYDFQANQVQLRGPVPEELYHRYVEFKPFVQGMFTATSLRGRILNRALHHQHARIYNFDRSTTYGSFPEPSREMTQQFLDLVHYDEGGRIFTYVLSLDGQWRFTETGKDFGIDLLSKHTMHSDVSIYIAFSGEFFIRRMSNPTIEPSEQRSEHPPDSVDGGPPKDHAPEDPAYYHLFIDNDSGTYRPNKDLLPLLRQFMERNLPGLHISTLDCNGDKDKMDKMKSEQRESRKNEGDDRQFVQADSGHPSGANGKDASGGNTGEKMKHKLQEGSETKGAMKDLVHGGEEREKREEREEKDDMTANNVQESDPVGAEESNSNGQPAGIGLAEDEIKEEQKT